MNKILVIWKIDFGDILFKELISMVDLPRIGETVIYMKQSLLIKNIEHNFDEKFISVITERI